VDDIIPFAVEAARLDVESGEFGGSYLASFGVVTGVEFGVNL
jgi:hypothetical protein